MSSVLKTGVVGCGWIARDMIRLGRLNRKIRFTACCDTDVKRAESAARLVRSARVFSDYEEMLEKADMDAVYVAVPHVLHFPVITRALQMGYHVFTEKPITTTLEDALSLKELSGQTGKKVGVNYQYRYDPGCYALVQAAKNGDLGELLYGRCNIPWHREESYFTASPWHASREASGGGTLITQGSHSLDILLWAIGAQPEFARGVSRRMKFTSAETEDLASGILECEGGRVIEVCSSMIAVPQRPVTIELYGDRGTGIFTAGRFFSRVRFFGCRVRKERLAIRGLHPLARSLEAFRRWILDDDISYHNSLEDALPVLASVLAIYGAAKSGKREAVERV